MKKPFYLVKMLLLKIKTRLRKILTVGSIGIKEKIQTMSEFTTAMAIAISSLVIIFFLLMVIYIIVEKTLSLKMDLEDAIFKIENLENELKLKNQR